MITIREAKPSDAAYLLRIYTPYVLSTVYTFEVEPPTLEEFRARIERFQAKFPYLVAEDADGIVGYCYAHPFHERAAFQQTVETTVYVERERHSRGVGSLLYNELFRRLDKLGIHVSVAVLGLPNEASRLFHEKHGFRHAGTLTEVGKKFGEWRDVGYMVRKSP